MSANIDHLLQKARHQRPNPLPHNFAERVLRGAARRAKPLPLIATRAGILASAAAAVLVAAAVSREFVRPQAPAEPPPLGAFSTPLLVP